MQLNKNNNDNNNDLEAQIINFSNKLQFNQNNKLILSSLLSNSSTFSLIIYILSKQKKSSNDIYILTSFLKEKKNLISLLSKEGTNFENILKKISINLKNFFNNKNTFIFKVGEKGNLFYIILKGKVSVLVPKQIKITMTYYNYINHLILLYNYDEKYLLEQTIKLNQKIFDINKNLLHNIKTQKNVNLKNFENLEEYLNIINHNYKDINKSFDNEEEIDLMGYFKIITLSEGSTFGEIALINENNKRTASIFCETNCNLGILSSNEYKNCIKSIQIKIKKDNINFVLSNKLFNQISFEKFYGVYWNYFIKGKIKKNEYLFKENDKRNFLYIIDDGEIKICKKMNKSDIEKTIYKILNYKDNELKNFPIKINHDNDDFNSNEKENIIFISDNNHIINSDNNIIKSNENIFLDESNSEIDYSNNNKESKDKKKIEIIINIVKHGDLLGLLTINNEHLFNAVCISNECSYFALDINLFNNIMKKHYNIQINFIELKKNKKKFILERLYKIMEIYKKTVNGEFRDKNFYINKEIKNIIGNCYKKKINNFLNNKKFILEKKKIFSLHNKNNKKYSVFKNDSDIKNKITAYNLYNKKINSRNSNINIYKIKNDINSYNNSNSNNYYFSNSNIHTQNNSSNNIKKLNKKIKSLINLKHINNNFNLKNIITSYSNNNTFINTTTNNTSSNNIKNLYKKNKNIDNKIINNIFISNAHKNKKINHKFIDFLLLDKLKTEENKRPVSEQFYRNNNLPLNYLPKAKPLRIKLKSFF